MKPLTGQETYLSSGDYLGVIRDFALSKGVALDKLLEDTEIDINELINPPKLVNNVFVSRVAINLYAAFVDPINASIELGLRMNASSHGSLGIAVQYAQNLNEAYELLKTYYHTRINSQDLIIEETPEALLIRIEDKVDHPIEPPEVQRFFNLSTLVSIASNTYAFLDHIDLGDDLMILDIDTFNSLDSGSKEVEGTVLNFGADTLALRVPINWKLARLKVANETVTTAAQDQCRDELKYVEPKGLLLKVKQRLSVDPGSMPGLGDIANEFYMSPATFKRHLKDEGTTYQQLKNEVRFELAKLMLQAKEHTESIAQKLGFSDASNFTKAFKQWTGQTPKAYLISQS